MINPKILSLISDSIQLPDNLKEIYDPKIHYILMLDTVTDYIWSRLKIKGGKQYKVGGIFLGKNKKINIRDGRDIISIYFPEHKIYNTGYMERFTILKEPLC